jgi:hypothetical protein
MHYGAAARPTAATPKRITKILDAEGVLVLEYLTVDVGTSPWDVLDDCRVLFGD